MSCHNGGTTIKPNPQTASITANSIGRVAMKGTPESHTKKNVKNTDPNGIPPRAGKMKAFFAGLPLHKTFSFAPKTPLKSDKNIPVY